MSLDKIKGHKTLLFLVIFSIFFAFQSSRNWLEDGCIVTASDFEALRTLGYFIQEQLFKYHSLYPVTFESVHGGYQFVYSYVPFLIPAIFAPFLGIKSHIIVYIFFYSLIPFTMYILLRNITKNEFISLLLSLYFLISNTLNVQYTVYGSYHTIIALPFMLLAINSLVNYEKTKNRKKAAQFAILSFLVGVMHLYTFIFYLFYVTLYSLVKKEKEMLMIILLVAAALSYYLIPTLGQQMIITSEAPTPKNPDLPDMVRNFDFLFFKKYTNYTPEMDANYGPYLILSALLLIIISCVRRDENRSFVSSSNLRSNIPDYLLMLAISGLIWVAAYGYTSFASAFPLERLGFFAQISFLLLIGAALSKTRINLPIFLSIASLFILASNNKTRLLAALIIPSLYIIASYAIPKFDEELRKRTDLTKIKVKDTITIVIIVTLLFYPLTGLVFSSNTEPRFWCSTIPHAKEIITEKDIYHDSMESYSAISTQTKAKRSGGVGGVSYHTLADPALEDNHTYNLLKKEEVTKIIIGIYSNDYMEKYAHLFKWFGEPTVIQGTRRSYPQYYFVFNTRFTNERNYKMKIITPTRIEIEKNPDADEQLIHLSYHPWWQTDSKTAILSKDADGFTVIKNSKGISKITITWNYTYFYIGWIITILSVILLIYLIKKQHHDKITKIMNEPDTTVKQSKKKHSKK